MRTRSSLSLHASGRLADRRARRSSPPIDPVESPERPGACDTVVLGGRIGHRGESRIVFGSFLDPFDGLFGDPFGDPLNETRWHRR